MGTGLIVMAVVNNHDLLLPERTKKAASLGSADGRCGYPEHAPPQAVPVSNSTVRYMWLGQIVIGGN